MYWRTANLRSRPGRAKIVRMRQKRYRNGMRSAPIISCVLASAALLLASACAVPNETNKDENKNPFVYYPNEFNRATFSKPAVIPDSITVCYNKYGTTPQSVANMAVKECAKFNKTAEFDHQSLLVCPLFTPIGAIYKCNVGKH